MPKRHIEASQEALQILDSLPQTRCPGCGYFHTGDTPLCVLCTTAPPVHVLPSSSPLSEWEEYDDALPAPALEESLPPCPPSPPAGAAVALDAPVPPSPQPPRRQSRQKCRCCTLLHHKALNEALNDPLQTQRTIAGRFGVSLHSLTQHRRVCMGLPPFGKQESGQRRQFLRRTATKHQTNPLCPSFVSCVRQELERMEGALKALVDRMATLRAQQAQMAGQVQALRTYLQLSTQSLAGE